MKHYKDNINNIYAYEADGSQDAYIKPDLVQITDEEADAIRNPSLTPEQIQAQINQEALAYLANTDWYIVRYTETLVAIPDDVKLLRSEARLSIV